MMNPNLLKIFKKTSLITIIALLCSESVYAFFRYTKDVVTDEGIVNKVIFDGTNPVNYPLQLFIISFFILIIVRMSQSRQNAEKHRERKRDY